MRYISRKLGLVLAALLFAPITAMAQDDSRDRNQQDRSLGEGALSQTLPPPQSDEDPRPPVAAPEMPETGVVTQAGIGGRTAYGRAGVVEFGGSAGFTRAAGFTQLNFSPTVGWFFMDNIQLSGILGLNYSNVDGVDSGFFTLLAEPSFHLPFSDAFFGFLGVGVGLAYAADAGVGFALAPRLGVNLMVGRSGILTPALFLSYTTTDLVQATEETALLGVSLSFGLNVGYTVMW